MRRRTRRRPLPGAPSRTAPPWTRGRAAARARRARARSGGTHPDQRQRGAVGTTPRCRSVWCSPEATECLRLFVVVVVVQAAATAGAGAVVLALRGALEVALAADVVHERGAL